MKRLFLLSVALLTVWAAAAQVRFVDATTLNLIGNVFFNYKAYNVIYTVVYKGFTKSALSTIRCAPHPHVTCRTAESLATSPTMKGVCRLEELRLTSANEDESKRFTILRAMCSILENGREDCDGDTLSLTNPSQSWREKEALSAELAVLCKRSG